MKTAIQVCSIIFVGLFLTFSCTPTSTTETPILSLSTVSTTAASGVTSSGATLGGNVTADGNATVSERGVVYATTQTPTTANTKVAVGTGTGSFTTNVTGLTAGTTYYVRAYAINSQGTAYGSQETFTCSLALSLPTVTTTPASAVTSTGATLGGNVTSDGNAAVSEKGVVYATTANPTTSNTKVVVGTGGTGSYSTTVTGLTAGTTYYVRAYAINSQGTAYGSQETFTCSLALSLPTVSTTPAASITSSGATLGGNVTADGNASVTEKGVVYATTANPTTSNTKVVVGTGGTGSFTTNVTGLIAGTTYYVRAYATNSAGTGYGSEVNFTTTTYSYTVAVSSNPLLGGVTTGGGSFDSGTSVTVTAVPNAGYTFTNWTEGVNIVSTNANYLFTIAGNRTLVANYAVGEPYVIPYNVAVSSNPLLGGTTTGGGTFNSGTSVTVTAVPSPGFTFTNWTEGANIVSFSAIYLFTIARNRTLVANYAVGEPYVIPYNVAVSSNPLLGGTTTGGGTFNSGTSVTVTAIANIGYTFTNWTEGGIIVSTNANYLFTIAGNRTLVANYR